jgi:hypothetical protein
LDLHYWLDYWLQKEQLPTSVLLRKVVKFKEWIRKMCLDVHAPEDLVIMIGISLIYLMDGIMKITESLHQKVNLLKEKYMGLEFKYLIEKTKIL